MEGITLEEFSSLDENIHVKTQEVSQNTDLDMQEFLGIELLNNTSKLTEINKRIKKDTKKLEEAENDPIYSDEQSQLYREG